MSKEPVRTMDSLLSDIPAPELSLLSSDYADALAFIKQNHLKIIVLDDDPTGIQTVHDVSVYTEVCYESFLHGFQEKSGIFFVLTNSRSLSAHASANLHKEIAGFINRASEETGLDYLLISRSDSTLRGHYPLETKVLADNLNRKFDGEVIAPFFKEGGRITVDNIHYVQQDGACVPAAMTEFAHDRTFGFHSSDLREWVEEKTAGAYSASSCICIGLSALRSRNYKAITDRLLSAADFAKIILNATEYTDVMSFTVSLVQAIARGKRFLFRSAAAVPKILGGISDIPLLNADSLHLNGRAGLVMVGSYVNKTTVQLNRLRSSELPLSFIEFKTDRVAAGAGKEEAKRIASLVDDALRKNITPVVYTSRELPSEKEYSGDRLLSLSVDIAESFAGVFDFLSEQPAFLISKGGITSAVIGTRGLKVSVAVAAGQVLPGIPVWLTGASGKYSRLPYVIFPGNVGGESALLDILSGFLKTEK